MGANFVTIAVARIYREQTVRQNSQKKRERGKEGGEGESNGKPDGPTIHLHAAGREFRVPRDVNPAELN